ncbi:Protein psiA [Hondaea fermentalgiana]|uniref:Protein psiA n=1 Tax=Hondaea fermentalgiana TaxID=2315210 RepID=A0A2R5G9G4_9STRA|nr:Protein psiA [Hondaea fermentalgiana]|eukprot:GBG27676.1 Protein psiA [Hondaea fermentalgiana]
MPRVEGRRVAWLSFMALTAVVFAEAYTAPDTLTYRLTIRDFLPSHCLAETEYLALYEYYDHNGYSRYKGMRDYVYVDYADAAIPDAWFADNLTQAMDFAPGDGPGGSSSSSIPVNHYCPYWTQGMSNGTIKSHPDFEAAFRSKVSGASKCYKGGAYLGSCSGVTSVIKPTLEIATSGLPKVVYCNSTYNSRCGKSQSDGNYTTSRQQYFSAWYNDDPVYNKRVGIKIDLEQQSSGLYEYSSGSFYPLRKFDNARDEGLYTDGLEVLEENYPDPNRAPVWPNSLLSGNHFWFTTEFHTYFEYSGDEEFKFLGDDDFWVFINEKPAIDLGGTHPPADDSIVLSDYADENHLNLTVGEVYALSIFHAERHTSASNFNVYTSISESCNVARPGTSSVTFNLLDAASDDDVAFSDGVVRDAESGVVQLTSAESTSPGVSTWLFTPQAQNVGAGFVVTFSFRVLNEAAAEGLAFVATRRPEGLDDMPIATGAGLGHRFMTHAVAVSIDLCNDRADGDACEAQEIRLQYPDSPEGSNADLNGTTRVFDGVQRSLRYSNETHTVSIEYLQRPDWLEVYLDDSLYLRRTGFDLEAIIGGRDAYIGLTSATGDASATLEILNFTLATIDVEPSETDAGTLIPDAETLDVLGDGEDAAGFTIQTRDLCGNVVQNGGYGGYMKAWYIPVRAVDEMLDSNETRRVLDDEADNETEWIMYTDERVEASIVDNEDGSYTALLSSTAEDLYALYACFGPDCAYNWTTMEPMDSTSFYSHVDFAVRVNALTPAPTRSPVEFVSTAEDDSNVVMYSAVGGGVTGFLLIMSMALLFIFRRRWQRDKAFIEEGKLYNLERAVEYDPNDEYTVVTRMVMDTSADLQRERAMRAVRDGTGDIATLESQNEELQEQIRMAKQRKQLDAFKGSRVSRFLGKPKTARKVFSPETL